MVIELLGKVSPIALAVLAAGIFNPVSANELMQQIENYSQEGRETNLNQVTNVNQIRDVSPTDWAYEALRSLVDRYGCISGFPNQTYRGNQALSRYEFAAGLNSCLNQIERLIASSESVVQEDVATMNRLAQEFEAELATIGGRIDNIESRTAFLEENQFSTTTKLAGEVIFGIASVVSGSTNDGKDDIDTVPVFGERVRLELETSFTGEDLLFTRLSTGNFPSFAESVDGVVQGDLAFAEPAGNDVGLEVLLYALPIGENLQVLFGAAGLAADDIADTVSILDGDGGSGAISAFGTRSPLYLPPGETGVGVIYGLGEKIEISAGYLSGNASDPSDGNGLFEGSFSGLGQITFTPIDRLTVALTYVHGQNQSDTGTGSQLSNIRSLSGEAIDTYSNSYGAQFSFSLSDRIVIGGWGGLSKVGTQSGFTADNGTQVNRGTQDIWNWAATLAFPDLGKEGSLAGVVVGMEPWVAKSTIDTNGFDDDAEKSLHVEAFYQYQLNDYIGITPGVVWINKPDNNEDNDDLIIGTIRTTFNF